MASSDDRNRPSSPNDDNPFIVFRRFADEQLSSLLQSIVGLPSAFSSPSNARWSAFDDEDQIQRREKEIRREWAALNNPENWDSGSVRAEKGEEPVDIPVKNYTNSTDSFDAQESSDDRKRTSSLQSYLANLPSLGSIMLSEHGPFPRTPFLDLLISGLMPASWPIGYLFFSPYSPLHLEREPGFQRQGDKWRNAFEDLMLAEQGKAMAERNSAAETTKSKDDGQWIARLLESGVLGDWKEIGFTGTENQSREPNNHEQTAIESTRRTESEDGETELEFYERFLGSQYPSTTRSSANTTSTSPSASEPFSASASTSQEPSGLGIVSTLTTTERKTMPDGSVHTKVVLKKRFADGREESSETVHTTQGSQERPHQAPLAVGGAEDTQKRASAGEEGGKKKGWFWSD